MSISPEKTKEDAASNVCCPPFDPSIYKGDNGTDYKLLTWKDKPFVKEGTWCLYYAPLNYGRAMTRACQKIDAADANLPEKEAIVLSDCASPWYSTMLVSSAKDIVAGAEMVKVSGTFLVKVFEGEYKMIGEWIKEVKRLVTLLKDAKTIESVDVEKLKFYFYYTTCPKCIKKYGKNYVVLFAKLSDE